MRAHGGGRRPGNEANGDLRMLEIRAKLRSRLVSLAKGASGL